MGQTESYVLHTNGCNSFLTGICGSHIRRIRVWGKLNFIISRLRQGCQNFLDAAVKLTKNRPNGHKIYQNSQLRYPSELTQIFFGGVDNMPSGNSSYSRHFSLLNCWSFETVLTFVFLHKQVISTAYQISTVLYKHLHDVHYT
jgi:hypothetical protein